MGYVIYIIAGILWGMFALEMQKKFHKNAKPLKNRIAFFINAFFWLVCIPIAIINMKNGKHSKYFKN